VRVALVALENPAVRAVRVALAVLENRVARAVQVAPENRAVQVALPVLVRQQAAALARQVVAALLSQVAVAEKEAQTRSVDISRRGVAAAALSLAAVGALLKPRAAGVAVA
jgi:hypothetical protein